MSLAGRPDASQGNPSVQVHLAQLYARQNDREALGRMLGLLAGAERRLNPDEQRIVEELREAHEPGSR